jgi:hypothetical protein
MLAKIHLLATIFICSILPCFLPHIVVLSAIASRPPAPQPSAACIPPYGAKHITQTHKKRKEKKRN